MRTGVRSPPHVARLFLPALAIVFVLGFGEAALAACYDSGQQLPARVVSQFINEPGRLLTQFPSGGPQMISAIRDLVASDPGTLPLITELNTKGNAEQVQAIGTGLGQSALVCARTAQAFADEIQRVTIATNNKPMTEAFGAVMGDQFLGLAGPAVGGGGAGTTGQIGSTGGTSADGVPLSLTTSVSNLTTRTTATGFGGTPSQAVGASFGEAGGSTLAGSPGGSLFTGKQNGSIFAGNPNNSGGPSIQGNVNAPNFTANTNSPISVSPSRPR